MNHTEIRRKRVAAGIAGAVLCAKLNISRSKLSDFERGFLTQSHDEIAAISSALDDLIAAQGRIHQFAAELGWPTVAAAI